MSENRQEASLQDGQNGQRSESSLVRKLVWACAGSFAFCFAMIPLYQIYCEVTGANGKTGRAVAAGQIDRSRTVEIQFDSSVNSKLPWTFAPMQRVMNVNPGAVMEARYMVRNDSDRAIVGKAVPSVAPNEASIFFNKTECFCFTEQLLKPGESMELPVRFVVDPEMPGEVYELTLSYTFYADEVATRKLAANLPKSNAAVASH